MTSENVTSKQVRPWLWLIGIITAMLLCHGIGESDLPDFLTIAPNTFKLLAPVKRQFLYSSPLNYMLGDFLGAPTIFGFYFIHIAEIFGMLVTILVCLRKKFPAPEDQLYFLALLSLTPLWLIILKWIGKPDPILVSMMFLCWALPGRWRWLFIAIMVMAHREMGTFMCISLFVAEEGWDYTLLFPILLGDAFHYAYENFVLNQKPVSRTEDLFVNIWLHPKQFLKQPALYAFGAFSWFWMVIIAKRPQSRVIICLLGVFAVAVFTEDFTRDFILMALPPILFHIEYMVKNRSSHNLMRYLPLGLMQIQIAAQGVLFKSNNTFMDWLTGQLGNQLTWF